MARAHAAAAGGTAAALEPASRGQPAIPQGAGHLPAEADDTLVLLFLCCHSALSPQSQLALTLRALAGRSHDRGQFVGRLM